MDPMLYDPRDLRDISLNKSLVWEEGWKQIQQATRQENLPETFDKIEMQISQADNKEKVLKLIKSYDQVLKTDPLNYEALFNLGRYYYLLAYGYTDDHKNVIDNRKEKKVLYLKQIQYCEQAMYSKNDFQELVDSGENVINASRALTAKEVGALCFWYYGFAGIWHECLSVTGKILNAHNALSVKKNSQPYDGT